MNEFLTWLLDAVQSVDPVLRTLLAGFAIMLETSVLVGLFVPGDTIVIIAATAVASPLEGVILVIAVVIGALIGESIGFWLGRYLGPKIRHSRLGRRIGEENWERSERYLRRRGGPAIFVSRFLPVLHSLVPLTVGHERLLVSALPRLDGARLHHLGEPVHHRGGRSPPAPTASSPTSCTTPGYIFVGIIVVFLAAGLRRQEGHRARRAQAPRTSDEDGCPECTPETVRTADDMED